MNYRVACMMLMATAIVVLAIPGFAQSGVVSASIPFEFTVADKSLPAGNYSIICDLSHQMVNIESRENDGRSAIRLASLIEDKSSVNSPKLVFNQREGRYFLEQVWTGASMGSQLMPGQIETGLAKGATKNQVTIAAK